MTIRFVALSCGCFVGVMASMILAEEAPPRIKSEDARTSVEKKGDVVFEVKHSK